MALINKYHLKGSGSWSLGQENPSIWQNYRTGITQDGSLTVIPASPGQPAERTTNVSVNAQSATAKVSMQNTAPSLQGKVMIPKTNNVEIRAGASTSYKIIKKLMKSDSVKVTREFIDKGKVKWLNVQTGKTNGWVVSSKLAPAPQVKSAAAAPKKSFVLKMGAKGSAVTALQSKLSKNRLFKGKINGTFDAATKTALITFQKKYKLKPDGIAGAATLSKLDALSANKKGGTK